MSEGRGRAATSRILAVDVAGYSRLMGADEEGTLAALRAIRKELGDPKLRSTEAASSKLPAMASWSNSPASLMRSAAPSRSSAKWQSATPTFQRSGGSSFVWA